MKKNNSFFSILNNQGMSLMEIVVALAIIGLLSILSMQIMKQVTTATKQIENTIEVDTFMSRLSTSLLDSMHCTKNFKNLELVNNKVSLSNIQNYRSKSPTPLVLVGKGSSIISPNRPFSHDYFVEDLYLEKKDESKRVTLNIIFKKAKGLGIEAIKRTLNLYAEFDQNNILIACYSDIYNLRDRVIADACSEINGKGSDESSNVLDENGNCINKAYDLTASNDDPQDTSPEQKNCFNGGPSEENGVISLNGNRNCNQTPPVGDSINEDDGGSDDGGSSSGGSSSGGSSSGGSSSGGDSPHKFIRNYKIIDGKIVFVKYAHIDEEALTKKVINNQNNNPCSKDFKNNGPEGAAGIDDDGSPITYTQTVDEDGNPYPLDENGEPIIPEGEEGEVIEVPSYGSTRDNSIVSGLEVNNKLGIDCD